MALAEHLVPTLSPTGAVVPADEAGTEAGHARPEPPQVAVLLEASPEGEEQHERDRPERGADLHGAHPVEVERLDRSDDIRPISYLVHHGLVVVGLHVPNLTRSN